MSKILFLSSHEFFQAQNAPKPVFGRDSTPDPAGRAYNTSRRNSRLERGHLPVLLDRCLWRLDLVAFGASLLDAFGVSISVPTAPRFTPDIDSPFRESYISSLKPDYGRRRVVSRVAPRSRTPLTEQWTSGGIDCVNVTFWTPDLNTGLRRLSCSIFV